MALRDASSSWSAEEPLMFTVEKGKDFTLETKTVLYTQLLLLDERDRLCTDFSSDNLGIV